MTAPGGRLLVVEDKATMRDLLERILSRQHQVETAADGGRALTLIAANDYDVILSDIRMPGAKPIPVGGWPIMTAGEYVRTVPA